AKLAEKHGAPILHEAVGPLHRYLVHDAAMAYCYQLGGDTTPQPTAPAPIRLRTPSPITSAIPGPVSEPDRCDHPPDRAGAPVEPPVPWQAAFLAALREHGRAPAACRVVGISIASAYLEREQVPTFAQAWIAAQGCAKRRQHEGGTAV